MLESDGMVRGSWSELAGRPCTLEGAGNLAPPTRSPVVGANRKERRSRNSSGRMSTLIVVLAFRSYVIATRRAPPPADRSMPTRTHGIRRGFISASQRMSTSGLRLPGEGASCEESRVKERVRVTRTGAACGVLSTERARRRNPSTLSVVTDESPSHPSALSMVADEPPSREGGLHVVIDTPRNFPCLQLPRDSLELLPT